MRFSRCLVPLNGPNPSDAGAYAVLRAARPQEWYRKLRGKDGRDGGFPWRFNGGLKSDRAEIRKPAFRGKGSGVAPLFGGEFGGKSGVSRGHAGIRILVITVRY